MFKKYYKEANKEIIADEVLISSVIANAHKPPKKRNQYINYAATLAAAVFVVSAAVISMPVWQRVEEDREVIIEEYVDKSPSPVTSQSEISEENTFPVTSPHSIATVIPPENDYDSSEDIKNTSAPVKDEQKTDDSNSKIFEIDLFAPQTKKENTSVEDNTEAETEVVLGTPLLPTPAAVIAAPVIIQSTESVDEEQESSGSDLIMSSDSLSETKDSVNDNSDSISDSDEGDGSGGSGYSPIAAGSSSSSSGGGAGSGAFYDAPSVADIDVYIPTPPGFYSTGSGSGYAYFASESGARITVNYSSCNYSSSPSYNESGDLITASFATGSVAYGIYAVGADMSDVEYIVNSLY